VRQHGGAALVRKVLAKDRLLDDHTVGHIKEVPTCEESSVQRRKPVAVRVHGREEQRFDQVPVSLRGDRKWLEDHALWQIGRRLLEPVGVLELRVLTGVEPGYVRAAPLLVGAAGHRQALVGIQRRAAPVTQPVGFAPEGQLFQGLAVEGH